MGSDWRQGFDRATPDTGQPADDSEGLVWRPAGNQAWMSSPGEIHGWVGSASGLPRAEVIRESRNPLVWVAWVQLGEPPGLSPVTTVGRYPTAEEAMTATDHTWNTRPEREDAS